MVDRTSAGHWIRRFLMEYATAERNLSANTCASYRDMLVLLLPYAAKRNGMATDALSITDLSAELVRDFLVHLEKERQCCTATRNQRLASIHALARFIGDHSPQHIEWCTQIRMIPIKKGTTASLTYLEKSEVDGLLAAPDQSSKTRPARPCFIVVPLQLRCPCKRGSIPPNRRHRLALQVRSDNGQGHQATPLSALDDDPEAPPASCRRTPRGGEPVSELSRGASDPLWHSYAR